MARDTRTDKIPKWASRETTPGLKIDPGPFIGVIKNNSDPARLGRLQVWIPDLGGEEEVSANWYTVSYASPFFGSTLGIPGNTSERSNQQTYGFWAVPPDLNNLVLVTFVMGDASRGYWFACVPNLQTQQMTPAIGRPANNSYTVPAFFGQDRGIPDTFVYLPAAEVNLESIEKDKDPNYLNAPRQILSHQANIVINQGLETDSVRGSVDSSSQRESPSQVIGLSSPGRTIPDTAVDFAPEALRELIKQGKDGLTVSQIQQFPIRKGGHSLVMDDGDLFGRSQLLRLRSAGGHQILLNDSANVIYVSNSLGTSWVELTSDGSVNIYSGNSVNIRSEKDLNFHADANVNVHAGDTIRMYAGSTIQSQTKTQLVKADDLYNINAGVVGIRSGGNMDLQAINSSWTNAGLISVYSGNLHIKTVKETVINSATDTINSRVSGWNTNTGELWFKGDKIYMNTTDKVPLNPVVPEPPAINPNFLFYKQTGVNFDNVQKRWKKEPGKFESIAPITPTHEPWERATGKLKNTDGTVEQSKLQGEDE